MCSKGTSGQLQAGRISTILEEKWAPDAAAWLLLLGTTPSKPATLSLCSVPILLNPFGSKFWMWSLNVQGEGRGIHANNSGGFSPNVKGALDIEWWWQLFTPRILNLYHQDSRGSGFIDRVNDGDVMTTGHRSRRNATVSQGQIKFEITK